MRVPPNNGRRPPRPPSRPQAFDPWAAIAAAWAAPLPEQLGFSPPAVPQPPRSTIEAPPPEPPPEEPVADVVDLGEARARLRPEADKHAELLAKLAPLGEVADDVSRLRREFAAANDGSLASLLAESMDSVNSAIKGIQQTVGRHAAAHSKSLQAELGNIREQATAQQAAAQAERKAADGQHRSEIAELNSNIGKLLTSQGELASLIRAPKRIVRDKDGRAIGSVVDPTLR